MLKYAHIDTVLCIIATKQIDEYSLYNIIHFIPIIAYRLFTPIDKGSLPNFSCLLAHSNRLICRIHSSPPP
jgi:hypothetical protein